MSEHEDFLTLPPVEPVGDVIAFEFDESKVKRDGGKFSKTAGAGKAEGGGPAGGKFAQPGADAPPSPSEASDEDLVELEKLHIERYKRNPTAREKIKGELKEVKQEMERRESPPPSGGGGEEPASKIQEILDSGDPNIGGSAHKAMTRALAAIGGGNTFLAKRLLKSASLNVGTRDLSVALDEMADMVGASR